MNHVWNYPLVQSWCIFKIIRSLPNKESSNISPNSWSLSRVGDMIYKREPIGKSSLNYPLVQIWGIFKSIRSLLNIENPNFLSKRLSLPRVGDMFYKWEPVGDSSLKLPSSSKLRHFQINQITSKHRKFKYFIQKMKFPKSWRYDL